MKTTLFFISLSLLTFNWVFAQVTTSKPGGELDYKESQNPSQSPKKRKFKFKSPFKGHHDKAGTPTKEDVTLKGLDEAIAKKFTTVFKQCTKEKDKFQNILELYPLLVVYRSSLEEGLNKTSCKRCQNSCFGNLVMATVQNEIPMMTDDEEKFVQYLITERNVEKDKARELYEFFISFEDMD